MKKKTILNGNVPIIGYSDRVGCYTVSLGLKLPTFEIIIEG
jgi:hypothetical protein